MAQFKVNYNDRVISKNFVYLDYNYHKNELHKVESGQKTFNDFSIAFNADVCKVDSCLSVNLTELGAVLEDVQRLAKEYSLSDVQTLKWKKKAQDAALKRNTTVLYNKLVKLEAFCSLNKTAAIKLLKKQDKIALATDCDATSLFNQSMEELEGHDFANCMKLRTMKFQVEILYAEAFCEGILEEAKGKLLLTKMKKDPKISLEVNFKVGVVLSLVVWLIKDCIIAPHLSLLYLTTSDPTIYVYAAVGALVLYRWLWGCCVYMWDSVGIDYILILDLDASKHMPSSTEIFSDASDLSILYLANVIIFHGLRFSHAQENTGTVIMSYLSQRAYMMPILLVVGTCVRATHSLCQSTSYGVFSWRTFQYLFSTPMHPLELRHNYAANILCSFTKVFSAFLYSSCYFVSGSFLYCSVPNGTTTVDRFAVCTSSPTVTALKVVIYLIPNFIRFLQCLRQRRDYLFKMRKEQAVVPVQRLTGEAASLSPGGVKGVDFVEHRNGASSSMRKRRTYFDGGHGHIVGAVSNEDNNSDENSDENCDNISDGDVDERSDGDGDGANYTHYGNNDDYIGGDAIGFASGSSLGNMPVSDCRAELCDTSDCAGFISHFRVLVWHIVKTVWVWPYSYNALRYFMKLCVIIFGAYPPQDPYSVGFMRWYVPLHILSTLYSCYWDVANDFGLMKFNSSKPLLRKVVLYKDTEYFYYIVLTLNPILRFFWSLSFTPYGSHPFLVIFEIFRRSMWSCLRMELVYIQELERRK
mmetsp:Transcript_123173/g.241631  ORF Transcript_123173/g.241631 Transcript_123173/m.241631 type:complete len:753 (+) Transcript_123173:122-2380(+)